MFVRVIVNVKVDNLKRYMVKAIFSTDQCG